jgi:hypothetical protein
MVIQLVSSLMTKDMIDDFIEILDLADVYIYIYIFFFPFGRVEVIIDQSRNLICRVYNREYF